MSSQVHGTQHFDKAKRAEIKFSPEAMQTVQTIIRFDFLPIPYR